MPNLSGETLQTGIIDPWGGYKQAQQDLKDIAALKLQERRVDLEEKRIATQEQQFKQTLDISKANLDQQRAKYLSDIGEYDAAAEVFNNSPYLNPNGLKLKFSGKTDEDVRYDSDIGLVFIHDNKTGKIRTEKIPGFEEAKQEETRRGLGEYAIKQDIEASTKAKYRETPENRTIPTDTDDAYNLLIDEFKYLNKREPDPVEKVKLRKQATDEFKRKGTEQFASEKAADKAANRVEKLGETADSAEKSLSIIAKGEQLVNQGIYAGSAAKIKRFFDKWLQEANINIGGETATNTDTFASLMGKQVGQVIRDFGSGTGLSDADREYAEKIAGGDITLTGDAIRKLLDINKRLSVWDIEHYNMAVEDYNKGQYFKKREVPAIESAKQSQTSSGNRYTIKEVK